MEMTEDECEDKHGTTMVRSGSRSGGSIGNRLIGRVEQPAHYRFQ
jgi:hypothetical protein